MSNEETRPTRRECDLTPAQKCALKMARKYGYLRHGWRGSWHVPVENSYCTQVCGTVTINNLVSFGLMKYDGGAVYHGDIVRPTSWPEAITAIRRPKGPDGPEWYYWCRYPRSKATGPFSSRRRAVEHAESNGYRMQAGKQ
jgi:hypothetical protein